jgi:5'-nucleotidase
MAERPLILLSNDDGVHAPGLVELRKALLDVATVITVAPETEQSATGHGITLHRPVRYRRLSPDVHALDGTPVDCVYVALHLPDVLPRRPDLVVSGINHGPNLGSDVFYSGTVAAAREGALRGIASIAFSQNGEGDMKESAGICASVVERLLAAVLPAGDTVLLNVNLPAGRPRGIRVTRLGRRHYVEGVDKRQDPRGRHYLWIGGPYSAHHEPIEGSDTEAIDEGYASITPLLLRAENPDHVGLAAFVAGPAEAAP